MLAYICKGLILEVGHLAWLLLKGWLKLEDCAGQLWALI